MTTKGSRFKTQGSKSQESQGRKSQGGKDVTRVLYLECPGNKFSLPISYGTSQASHLGGLVFIRRFTGGQNQALLGGSCGKQ